MTRKKCPDCGESTLLPILLGMPLPGQIDDPDVILGGCILPVAEIANPSACEAENCVWSEGTFRGLRAGAPYFLETIEYLTSEIQLISFSSAPFDELVGEVINSVLRWHANPQHELVRTVNPDVSQFVFDRLPQLLDSFTEPCDNE